MMYSRVISNKATVILFASVLLQTIPCRVHSQPPSNFVQDDFQHKINLYDVDGHPIGNEAIETKDGNDIEVEPGQVKELAILDTLAVTTVAYRFICGFQPIDNNSLNSYYLLLDSGKVSFLESMRKVFKQDKNDFSGETHREYTLYDDFYIVSNGKMARIKRDPKFFLELTKDKQGQMDDYLQKTKVSFRSIEDIRQFTHYYNGLP